MSKSTLIYRFSAWFLTPQVRLIWLVTIGLMLTENQAFFKHLLQSYPWSAENAAFLISVTLFFIFATALWLMLICQGRFARWLLALIVLLSAFTAYYMDEFGVVIDTIMLDNALKTDTREIAGLLSLAFVLKVMLLGLLPAILLLWGIPQSRWVADTFKLRMQHVGAMLIALVLIVTPFTKNYVTLVREHKLVRMYANPTFFNYSLIKWAIVKTFTHQVTDLTKVAEDSVNVGQSQSHTLIVMVVGETARYDRFSLNGYYRDTNPKLSRENVISFQQVNSCGTSTGISVPCMFSVLPRKKFDAEKALHMQNALDILSTQDVKILWRDNNSDSKGVALRVLYEDFKTPTLNPVCEANECRDIGMLSGLEKFVAENKDHNILIILHQMGNHGPEYYRRYPESFKQFQPICLSSRLSECTQASVDNAYDNAILYTDYFLSATIQFLKNYDTQRKTAMFYIADHGESLGEHGFYLHAAPYEIAPKEQTHVPAILWLGPGFASLRPFIETYRERPLSHDDVFCTLLTTFALKTHTCPAQYQWLTQNKIGQ